MEKTNPVTVDFALRETTKIAVLDIGSNSFHFVVGEVRADGVKTLYRLKQKVRLAEGLSADNVLSDSAISRGLLALKNIKSKIELYEPDVTKIVATYALRNASNIKEFLIPAKDVLATPIDIISGEEEAEYIFKAVACVKRLVKTALVIDIGGGSTEFIVGTGADSHVKHSINMGCVSYTQQFFSTGEFTEQRFESAINSAVNNLNIVKTNYLQHGWDMCIGTSGSVESMVSVIANQRNVNLYDQAITLDDLLALKEHCIDKAVVSDLELGPENEDRKQVFAAGLSIMIAAFQTLEIKQLKVVSVALREGVMYDIANRCNI